MANSRSQRQQYVIKLASEIRDTTTTLADDAELFLPVKASKQYHFQCHIVLTSGATPAFKYTFTVPSGTAGNKMAEKWHAIAPTAVTAIAASQAVGTSGAVQIMTCAGYFITSTTSGNITLQWAQNTSDAGNTTVLKGSYFQIWEQK